MGAGSALISVYSICKMERHSMWPFLHCLLSAWTCVGPGDAEASGRMVGRGGVSLAVGWGV